MSKQTGVSVSHIYKIQAQHKKTGKIPDRKSAGRPKMRRDPKTAYAVPTAHNDEPISVIRLVKRLRLSIHEISYRAAYLILS